MISSIAAFSDTYLPTINGVTYTLVTWKKWWDARGGEMHIIYPKSKYSPKRGEWPVNSVTFPFYPGYRLAIPVNPTLPKNVNIVHTHTPFSLGLAGQKLAKKYNLPLVASYHTPLSNYVYYISPIDLVSRLLSKTSNRWESRFLNRADLILVHSNHALMNLREIGVTSPINLLKNGIDISLFKSVKTESFLTKYGIDPDQTILGYTGRHGYEKNLHELIQLSSSLDATILIGGSGPARNDLEDQANKIDANIVFLGQLPREELPAFYSALDLFVFPSPVETQGLVALESIACGTPVVAADQGALLETVTNGVTGTHYQSGDPSSLIDKTFDSLSNRKQLCKNCMSCRDSISIDTTIDQLSQFYLSLL